MRKKLRLKEIENKCKDEITFQSLEWDICDFYFEEEEKEVSIVNIFGNTEMGESICLTVRDFQPSFYVKVPKDWKVSDKNLFLQYHAINLQLKLK